MAIKFYGGHQLNSKAKVYGTRQDFETIEVDENGAPIIEPSYGTVEPAGTFLTRSKTGMPRTLYLRSTDDLDATPTTLVNTASGFGTNEDMAVHQSGQYIAVADLYEGGDGVVFVYDIQDLSAPLATLSPDGGESTYNQNYQFGKSMAMSDTKLFIGNNAQGVPVYCYDLSDLSAAPSKISSPTTYHQGDYMFSSDMTANSTHLFIGHPQSREPINSSDNNTEAGAVHVYDAETLQYQTSVFGFNGEYGDYFGSEVKATDTHLAVGAYGDDEVHGNQNQNGAVYVFDATDLSATPTKVMPQTSGYSDEFARFISLSDTHLAVSEYQDNTHKSNSGALHIYDLTDLSNPMINYGSLYSEYYGLRPLLFNDGSNRICFYRNFANLGQPAKYFVYNIDDLDTPLWESETEMPYAFLPPYTPVTPRYYKTLATQYVPPPPPLLVVSGPYAHPSENTVFVYDLTNMSEGATGLMPFDNEHPDPWSQTFGSSVRVTDKYILVGSDGDNDNNPYSGSVYVYDKTDLSVQPTKLLAFDGDEYDVFGNQLDYSDGYIFVGARGDDNEFGNGAGAVYVYDENDLSAQPIKLTGSSPQFGLRLSAFNGKLAVSSESGVFVYDINNLAASPTQVGSTYNEDVLLSASRLFIGIANDNNFTGKVEVYDINNLAASPTQITAPDGSSGDNFGSNLALNSTNLYIGSYLDNDNGTNSGSFYVYNLADLSAQPTKMTAPDGSSGDFFSRDIVVDENYVVVGAYGFDASVNNGGAWDGTGAIYVYDANNLSATPLKVVETTGHNDRFGLYLAIG